MNSFINRQPELAALDRDYARPGASLFVLYGRRRLGKTALLRRFSEGKPAIYHMADRSTETDARRLLASSMASGLGEPTLASSGFADWYALLGAYDRVRPTDQKAVLILDEYQYLCEQQPAFSSMVQRWWDERWRTQNLMVVLCGSILSMMYRETLARSSPLFGRRTGQWLLSPMRFGHVQQFLPSLTSRAKLEMWSLIGGVPRYAELAAAFRSMPEALRGLVLDRGGPLYSEARFLLQDEVTTANVYWSLLHAIGSGANRITEIAGRMGMAANQLTRYLTALQEMGLVRRVVPVTEPNPGRSKRGIYQVTDSFLRLWFGCVAPFESLLEFGKVREAEEAMRERLAAHQAWAFEEVCRQYTEDHAPEFEVVTVGRYWDKDRELDVAGCDEQGHVVVAGECKWSGRPVDLPVARELERKVREAWPDRAGTIRLLLFSSGGFTARVRAWSQQYGARLIGCDELCG